MSTPYDADISDQSSVILNLKFPTFQDAPNNQLMLLLFTHKSHIGIMPMIDCKGTMIFLIKQILRRKRL